MSRYTVGTSIAATFASILLVSTHAFAQPKGDDSPRAPRQEAVDACVGKTAGTEVQFTVKGRDGESRTMTGTCQEQNGKLAARMQRPPHEGGERGERPARD
ncbi:hypothetical protein D8I35_14375 [Corticibacter populi]|uniref:DUF1161 domain-containing protein n=1 Tax=Corticibacter populi TaxID=1550736 RepID=A0A3M6QPR4_9BURK|nr:hypothetical protein [Corticibacter populi]RMX05028.1 hypothetical protein D8I35_14375 [Corticibacter populi]RZS33536.1 hypothetical protein EV687_1860 [Corticibacter populi]